MYLIEKSEEQTNTRHCRNSPVRCGNCDGIIYPGNPIILVPHTKIEEYKIGHCLVCGPKFA